MGMERRENHERVGGWNRQSGKDWEKKMHERIEWTFPQSEAHWTEMKAKSACRGVGSCRRKSESESESIKSGRWRARERVRERERAYIPTHIKCVVRRNQRSNFYGDLQQWIVKYLLRLTFKQWRVQSAKCERCYSIVCIRLLPFFHPLIVSHNLTLAFCRVKRESGRRARTRTPERKIRAPPRAWAGMSGHQRRNKEKLWNEVSARFYFYYWDEEQIVDLLPFVVLHIHANGKTINFRCNASFLEFAKEIR